jgi:hypothetical protein
VTDPVNGGLPEAAATLVSGDMPPHERIARAIEGDDETDLSGFATYAPAAGAAAEGEQGDDRAAVDGPDASPRSWGFDVEEINQDHALVDWGGKAVVVKEQPQGPINDRVRVMTFDSMNMMFANRLTEITGAEGKVKAVTWARAWLTHKDRRQYAGVEFFPNPDGVVGTPGYFNFWNGFEVQPSRDGSYALFRDHLFNNIAGGNEALFRYVFGWMAHIVQKPRARLGIALVLRGKRGTGKSKVGEVLGSLFAAHYFQVDDARYVTGRFNDHMISCLLLQADEALWAGDKEAEGRLKGLITSEMQMVEAKNMPAIRVPNYIRVLMTSNESWVVPAGADERRFCVLDVDPRRAQNHDYFKEMDDELASGGRARLLHDLLNFDLTSLDLWQIPQTHALLEQKIRSLEPIDDFWYNRLLDGGDWKSSVVCSEFYAEYLKHCAQIGIGRKRSQAEFGARLAKLIPDLRKSRPALEVEPGVVRRTWCYEIPSLDECRRAFDEIVGQHVSWPALPPGEGERTAELTSDEAHAPL